MTGREHDREVGRAVRELHPPDEDAALERAVALASGELRSRTPLPAGRRIARTLGIAGAIVAATAALALTPAGAEVREWMADAIDDEPGTQREALTRLPAGGQVLAVADSGAWLVSGDGSRRRLGDYEEAAFSPSGQYLAAARENELTALTPEGDIRWSVSRPAIVRDPLWAPSGFRIAFTEGRALSLIEGDGDLPVEVSRNAAPGVHSWRPPPDGVDPRFAPDELTYATEDEIVTVDATTSEVIWRRGTGDIPRSLDWAGPDRLVATYRGYVSVLDRRGRIRHDVPIPDGVRVSGAGVAPDGERVAIVAKRPGRAEGRLILARIAGGDRRQRTVFSGSGAFGEPVWSPDGNRVLLPWPDTDQWLFVSPAEDRKVLRRVIAVGDIGRAFDPGGRGPAPAPRVEGWCCD